MQLDAVFPAESVESSEQVPVDMPIVDVHRSIVHATALVVERVLRARGVDPKGLIVSVMETEDCKGNPVHQVTATAPTYRIPVMS